MDADEIDTEIRKIFDTWESETAAALTAQTGEIADLAAREVLQDLSRGQRTRYTKAVVDGITDKIVNDYKEGMTRGGSVCVDAIYRDIGGGKIRATTKAQFIPWLNDFKEEQIKTIGDMFIEGQRQGVYPLDMVKDLREYFDGTYHRAVTAARTEAQKIRTTARMDSYRKSGIKYVQYITAEDDRVRPEHAARNGKVYPIDKAPLLGEYNCRCILTDADYLVEEEGAPVQESEAEIIDLEEMAQYGDPEVVEEMIARIEDAATYKEFNNMIAEYFNGAKMTDKVMAMSDIEILKDEFATSIQLFEDVPILKKCITQFGFLRKNSRALMQTHASEINDGTCIIKINAAYMQQWYANALKKVDKYVFKDPNDHQSPINTCLLKDTLTHETGHVGIFKALCEKFKGDNRRINREWNICSQVSKKAGLESFKSDTFPAQIVRNAYEKTRDQYGGNMNLMEVVKDLSKYATTNVQETIAESYSDYYRNFGNAKPISKEIVKTLNNMLNTGVYEL